MSQCCRNSHSAAMSIRRQILPLGQNHFSISTPQIFSISASQRLPSRSLSFTKQNSPKAASSLQNSRKCYLNNRLLSTSVLRGQNFNSSNRNFGTSVLSGFRENQSAHCIQCSSASGTSGVSGRWFSTSGVSRMSGGGGGGGDQDGVPQAGKYRSPWAILKEEFKGAAQGQNLEDVTPVPRETDVLVIGGGAVGSSVAYWLKQQNPKGMHVTVVERDPTYTQASTMLSVGGLRHQFSLEENIRLSLFTTDFLRNIKEHLSVLDDGGCPPDVQFNHAGYLFLATSRSAPLLEKNVQLQRKLGAKIDLLSKEQLATTFPWLNTNGIEVGSHGIEGEGWFDPWLLVKALKQKNISFGVKYVAGELEGFEYYSSDEFESTSDHKELCGAKIRTREGVVHGCKFAMVVNCAGPWAGEVARMAMIGASNVPELATPLPVEPRKRYVYVVHCPEGPGLNCPLTVDPTNVYFRREGFGGHYLCGAPPPKDKEPSIENLDVDYDFFQENVWPVLSNRVKCFQSLKMKSAWAGYYDYNYIDQNLIIGNHPYHRNFFFANGLSGHGLQHSVAVGHALMELIVYGHYKTIDLSRFGFERFMTEEYLHEDAIV